MITLIKEEELKVLKTLTASQSGQFREYYYYLLFKHNCSPATHSINLKTRQILPKVLRK